MAICLYITWCDLYGCTLKPAEYSPQHVISLQVGYLHGNIYYSPVAIMTHEFFFKKIIKIVIIYGYTI